MSAAYIQVHYRLPKNMKDEKSLHISPDERENGSVLSIALEVFIIIIIFFVMV